MSRPAAEQVRLEGSRGGPLASGRLERDLASMWKSASARTGGTAVSRACSATLVTLLAGEPASGEEDWGQAISRRYPCRILRVEEDPAGAVPLAASAGAVCHLRGAGSGLICVEEIKILARPEAMSRVPSAVRALAVGGLPLFLLAPGRCARGAAAFAGIAADADLVLVCSRAAAELDEPLPPRTRDLSWTGTARLREAWARAERTPGVAAALAAVEEARVEHGGPEPPAAALLAAGWLLGRLGGEVVGREPGGDPAVAFRTLAGCPGRLRFVSREDAPAGAAALEVGGGGGTVAASLTPGATGARLVVPAGTREVHLRPAGRADLALEEIHRHHADPGLAPARERAAAIRRALEVA